jgi:uncharacterized protein YndB with AHSA1/START domain
MAARRKIPARKSAIRKPAARKPSVRKALARRPKSQAPSRARSPASKAVRYAGVGSEAVFRATGKAWDEWLKALDRAGAKTMAHKDIALMLSRKFEVPSWWSQMVTVGYEQARGLRDVYQKASGYSANASKTFATSADALFNAWKDREKRARWLFDAPVEVKRTTAGKSIRMTWTVGESSVVVGFLPKGSGKCQVSVEHSKLKDKAAVLKQKEFWKGALERLQALLEPVALAPKR